MARAPQSRGKCQYCGEETAKSGMSRHLAKCEKRAKVIETANAGKQTEETLWHVRVQAAYDKDFWLDLEMRGSATLEKLDSYLRYVWLECCGHLSKFTVGGWQGYDVGKARKADDAFSKEPDLLHRYDFGTTSETEIHVVGSRKGKATTKHPIALMSRNNMPEMECNECGKRAAYLCIECLYEADEPGHGFFVMNMPKIIHTPNMASLFHYSIRHAWECADMKVPPNRPIDMKLLSALEYLLSAFAGVVARASCRVYRDIESLRGRMGESERQALC